MLTESQSCLRLPAASAGLTVARWTIDGIAALVAQSRRGGMLRLPASLSRCFVAVFFFIRRCSSRGAISRQRSRAAQDTVPNITWPPVRLALSMTPPCHSRFVHKEPREA